MSEQDVVDGLMNRIDRVVLDAMSNHPRSLQVAAGPSDLGDPCDVCLTRVLMGIKASGEVTAQSQDSWQATVGTAIHAWLEETFDGDNGRHGTDPDDQPWFLERKVHVGDLDDVQVWGSSDLFDKQTGTVIDWKTASPSAMEDARGRTAHTARGRKGHYRVQAHLYGRGYARLGYDVQRVLLCYVWRDGRWVDHTDGDPSPRDPRQGGRYVWSEPYDESVAVEALERATRLLRAGRAARDADLLDEHLASLSSHYRCYDCSKAKRHAALVEREQQQAEQEGTITSGFLAGMTAAQVDPVAAAHAAIEDALTRQDILDLRAQRAGLAYWTPALDQACRDRWADLAA